jgi:anti-anti-sigma factor
MRAQPGIMTDNKVNGSFNLSVSLSEKREGFFIIHPVGAINTNTSWILQNEVEQIFKSKPENILFDMKQVNYVNFRGLRVILKTILEMNQPNGKVYLTNLQPQVKEMFEIMNGTLQEWIFECRKQLENYLDVMHVSCSDYSCMTKFEAGMGKYDRGTESNSNQGLEQSSRM